MGHAEVRGRPTGGGGSFSPLITLIGTDLLTLSMPRNGQTFSVDKRPSVVETKSVPIRGEEKNPRPSAESAGDIRAYSCAFVVKDESVTFIQKLGIQE